VKIIYREKTDVIENLYQKKPLHSRGYDKLKNYFTGRMFAVQGTSALVAAGARTGVAHLLSQNDYRNWEIFLYSILVSFGTYVLAWIPSHRYFFREAYKKGVENVKSAGFKLLLPEEVGSGLSLILQLPSLAGGYLLMNNGLPPEFAVNIGSLPGPHKIPDYLAKLGVNSANSAILGTWNPRKILYEKPKQGIRRLKNFVKTQTVSDISKLKEMSLQLYTNIFK